MHPSYLSLWSRRPSLQILFHRYTYFITLTSPLEATFVNNQDWQGVPPLFITSFLMYIQKEVEAKKLLKTENAAVNA
jgi:hypothetical protein